MTTHNPAIIRSKSALREIIGVGHRLAQASRFSQAPSASRARGGTGRSTDQHPQPRGQSVQNPGMLVMPTPNRDVLSTAMAMTPGDKGSIRAVVEAIFKTWQFQMPEVMDAVVKQRLIGPGSGGLPGAAIRTQQPGHCVRDLSGSHARSAGFTSWCRLTQKSHR